MWKDIVNRRMFLCTTQTIKLDEQIEATPTTTVEKKNPDRSISTDKRIIADLRRVNLRFDTQQYYPVKVPTIQDITRWVLFLNQMYPGLKLKMTKRDVASAFRLLRLHPALAFVVIAEFPADHLLMNDDLVCVYLAMPFGWNGDPAHFARFGDAATRAHRRCGPLWATSTLMRHAFHSFMYVEDGIFVEVDVPERLSSTTRCWGYLAKGILGKNAINEEKLEEEEGKWEPHQIILGFVINVDLLTISLHEEEIAGAGVLIAHLTTLMGSQVITLLEVQQLRGHI